MSEAPAGQVEQGLRLSTPVTEVDGVGPARARRLASLGIRTLNDLLRHLPMRYQRELAEGSIADLSMEGIASARGTIVNTRVMGGMGRGKGRFQATLKDHSGTLALVWFNADFLRHKLHAGMVIRVTGKVKAFNSYPQMVNPRWEAIETEAQAPTAAAQERLRPVYPATDDLGSPVIEGLVAAVLPSLLPQVVDPLPAELCRSHNMPVLAEAYRMAHRPGHEDEASAARRRLAFNELLLLQMGIAIKRYFNESRLKAPALRWSEAIDGHIRARFPFELTEAQQRVVRDITGDVQRSAPMNRLLQGDVGSGKTVVALYALLMAVANRMQGAIMTPTELLAEQHYLSISRMLEGSNVRLALLTGSLGSQSAGRARTLEGIAEGKTDIVIGTQALLTESVKFADLAVVVIDEQHRFGVLQRAAFRQGNATGTSGGDAAIASPHYLVMTATPIPRTLSLTVFGDLDVSTIDKLPPGRTPITTRLVGPEKTDDVYRYLAQRLGRGEQAYVVVPTIDAAGHESATQLKSVHEHVALLADKYCRGFKVEAIHGRLKAQTRESVMEKFRAGKVHVLVATTVIEVGVDVPNATLMVIEHAERFGLAQLHQLRGRIGRGTHGRKSVCVLVAEPTTDEATQRLQAIAGTNDGFKIAEVDLQIRGMGDFFGTRQHGLPPLRVAQLPEDLDLLKLARRDAEAVVRADPGMIDPSHTLLKRILVQQYGKTLGLIDVG
ncbi:MAG: ATP-dependent DNA helicase RecG [Phycisphaeraceae bacterium]